MSAPYRLYGRDLELSAPTAADAERLAEVCDDPVIAAWVPVPTPYRLEDAEVFITQVVGPGWLDDSQYTWAMRRTQGGALDGVVSLRFDGQGSAELGYYVGADARGQGLCTRAVRRVLAEALDPGGLALARVTWRAVVGNWASWRVAWKCGFAREGTVRAEIVHGDTRLDAWVGTLVAGDAMAPTGAWDGPLGSNVGE